MTGQATFHRYPLDQFEAKRGIFDVRIERNRFRLSDISLDIHDELRIVTGAKVEKLAVDDETVEWVIRSRTQRLEIVGQRASTSILPGPDRVEMGKRVPETLKAALDLRLTDLQTNKPIFSGRGECAGLEVAGDIDKLRRAL